MYSSQVSRQSSGSLYHISVPVNGVQIGLALHNQTGKSQHTLVLLHGFTGSAMSWEPFFETLSMPGLRIIALDMLGHGRSDAPANPERYAMEYTQADISAVLQELAIAPGEAILLGYSLGGRVALYNAFSHYFRALILESASPGLAIPSERTERRHSDEALADQIERDGIKPFIDYWENIPLFASQQQLPAEQKSALHQQRLNNRSTGLANSLRGLGTGVQPALHNRLTELSMPVQLIAGALDHKFCNIAQQMAQQLPDGRLAIVPHAGHSVHLEQPATFVTLVRTFCQSILSA